jgi:hypothetical protein
MGMCCASRISVYVLFFCKLEGCWVHGATLSWHLGPQPHVGANSPLSLRI